MRAPSRVRESKRRCFRVLARTAQTRSRRAEKMTRTSCAPRQATSSTHEEREEEISCTTRSSRTSNAADDKPPPSLLERPSADERRPAQPDNPRAVRSSRAEERSFLLEDRAPERVLVAVGSGLAGEEVDEELGALGVRGDADERRRVRAASERSKSQPESLVYRGLAEKEREKVRIRSKS